MLNNPSPQLVLGAAQFGSSYGINNIDGQPSEDTVRRIIHKAGSYSINEIDTAQSYGTSESVLGRVLPTLKNSSLVIHSKFTLGGTETIPELLKKSLSRLGVNRLGYFYFHRFSDFLDSKLLDGEELRFVEDHSLGLAVSVYDENELSLVLDRSKNINAIQIPLNIFDRSPKKLKLLASARRRGIKVYARSIFLQGLFFIDPYTLSGRLKGLKEPLIKLNEISQELKVGKLELALGFVKRLNVVDRILIGVDCEDQLIKNLAAWATPLTPSALSAIETIDVKAVDLLKPMNWS